MRCHLIYSLCDCEVESSWHLLLTCEEIRCCWMEVGIWDVINPSLDLCENFVQFFFGLCAKLSDGNHKIFCMVLWSLWRKRNDKVWEGKDVCHKQVVGRDREALHNWEWAKTRLGNNQPSAPDIPSNPLEPPPNGTLISNINASFWKEQCLTGFGMCICEARGHFVVARIE